MPMILRTINDVQVGRINFDGGHVENINIDLFVANNDSLQLTFTGTSKAAVLRAQDING
jgi:hypothetical protein